MSTKGLPRWLRSCLKITGGAIIFIIMLWLGIALYVNVNKKALLQQITAQLNENISGTLTIESMKPELIRSFPAISVSLKNVLLRDSLYNEHHHDFLQAKSVYVAINAFSVLRKAPRIMNIEINTGKLFLFTDSNGYSNTSIFRQKNNVDTSRRKVKPHINHIIFHDVDFTFQNDYKFKLFHLDIHDLDALFNYYGTGWTARTSLSAFVKNFAFNTEKGSYMKDKEVAINISLSYDRTTEILSIPGQPIHVGAEKINIGGSFFLSQKPVAFRLNIGTQNILFQNAKELLPPSISVKLGIINLLKPLSVQATIDGRMKFRDTPLVHITWTVKNNVLVTPAGNVSNCSFTGLFLNQVDTSAGHTDGNSKISLYHLSGIYADIPFSADTIRALNLLHPVIEGRFVSTFPLTCLNPVIGGNAFVFNKGTADLNLLYKGGIIPDDTTASYVYGTIGVSGASMTYLPRRLTFTNTSALVQFNGGDILIQNAKVQSGTSILNMNGTLRNFLNLYYNDPTKIVLDWHISSSRIDLNEFRTFLAPRQSTDVTNTGIGKQNKTGATRVSKQLDNVLAVSNVHMQLQVNELLYKNFTATKIAADIQLAQSGITLTNISLNHAGGSMALHGNIDQRGPVNNFHVLSDVSHVHIQEFFRSFSNFGQAAITDKNLRGTLDAYTDVTGSIRDNGQVIPGSFNGTVSFDLHDGALVDFGPFIKVSKYVFRNRNLSNVTFNELKNTLDIKGDKITINPMLIESSAINLKVRGVYALSKGTDIDIDVPLRNPKKDELVIDDDIKQEREMKGIIIHLKAVDGDDGNVKIKLMMKKQDESATSPGKKRLGPRLLDKLRK